MLKVAGGVLFRAARCLHDAVEGHECVHDERSHLSFPFCAGPVLVTGFGWEINRATVAWSRAQQSWLRGLGRDSQCCASRKATVADGAGHSWDHGSSVIRER